MLIVNLSVFLFLIFSFYPDVVHAQTRKILFGSNFCVSRHAGS